ncbi:DnaJ homolog subfamily B member 12 [Marchantia polymorpha subsp. ruderalis]|uniref:J domain-containing protein n=2 Tax=Marchantia polymorpha TaxID=3197 RepID=A0AAF6BY48_MARPO|nr:hypothetical protein MARPO_0003s0073 [Marchantia polymorpha]BBN16932.1 hypothetical protein Mp_7g10540 [Marchantia polymorpha subsp. ruderalis]|eukprot:PTQ49173.1 hypothetical protein MARPO_0003s0073 [Marchantia polymorpha]
MDSNKDEGNKCMQIGRAALEAGDRERAIKFFTKAQRLYPNPDAEALLSSLYEGSGKQAADEKPSMKRGDSMDAREEKKDGNAGIRHRNGFHQAGSSSTAGSSDASAEQIEIVARIKRTKDYYQILGVTKECSEEDVKKAYRKISLKVHPDKNKASGAEEAFKAVNKAFHCLSDSELRAKYDSYGADEDHEFHNPIRRRRTAGNPVFYEDIFEPNDVFNSFFFGMQQPQGAFRRAHFTRAAGADARGGRQENHSNNLLGLLQLLPILALFLFSYFPFSQPIYSLEKVAPYQFQQKTKEYGVTFYVKAAEFDREYPLGSHSRRQVEAQVERDYREILIHNCRVEQGYHRWGQVREHPHCEKLQRFTRVS